MKSVAVVGASLAGIRAAETLRKEGYGGVVHLIGNEPHLPYDRPPLSKQVLKGEWDVDRTALTTAEQREQLDLTLHLGVNATALDVQALTVSLDSGVDLDVDGIVIATGTRTRTLGDTAAGVYGLRTVDDALAIRNALTGGPRRLTVVGAGFIGAEVAASARVLGIEVSMIEMAEVPFERSVGAEVGGHIAALHRAHGVDVRLGVGCSAIVGESYVEAVELSDASSIDTDLVVVGIGVVPNTEWLDGSGLIIDNGVVCDATLSAAPSIVAAGDVARWPNSAFGEHMRVEHWDNAIAQGVHAAKRLLYGSEVGDFAPVPWFWSDQYDRKFQLAGRTSGYDCFEIVDGDMGDPAESKFVALYGRNGRLTAVLGVNRPKHVLKYRMQIANGITWEDALALEI